MGGYRFRLPLSGHNQEEQLQPASVPLRSNTVFQLAQESMFEALNIPSSEMTETKKALFWGIIISLLNAIYFCATCVKRWRLGKTISLLEVHTTAHTFLCLRIQAFWWYKPPYVSRGHILESKAELALKGLSEELQAQLRGDRSIAYAYTIPERLKFWMWDRVDDDLISMDQANYRACIVFLVICCHAAIYLLPWTIYIPFDQGRCKA